MNTNVRYSINLKGASLFLRLGARIFKTGIAIILAMSIASLLPDDVGLKALAGVSAVVAMQPSIYRSFKTVSDQALGNIIGAILSVTMVTIFSDNFIIMGVTVIVLIAILFKFNLCCYFGECNSINHYGTTYRFFLYYCLLQVCTCNDWCHKFISS